MKGAGGGPAVAAALAAVVVLAACGRAAAPRGPAAAGPLPRQTRGYILISIDTLRADHLGCYGYARPTSPFLDSLARRATLFEEAYSQFPSTLVSHMSIFTGLYPREHGVLPPNAVLSPAIETLPETFHRHGFVTAGFTEGGYVSGRYGFRRGFDTFVARDRHGNRQVESTFRRGAEFLRGLRPSDRFFLFLHTYAVHTPYDAPPEYQSIFWPGDQPDVAFPPTGRELARQTMSAGRPPPVVVDWLRALYDAGIRQTDDVLRGFFAELDRLGLAGDVTVILTSDHGEEFLEHGNFNHTQLYRESLHVPLLVVHPDLRTAVRHAGVVQLIDIAPSLCELAHVAARQPPSGVSFARAVGRPAPPRAGTAHMMALDGVQAVYRGERRRLDSLLLFDPPAGSWLPRRVSFDAQGPLAFNARAFAGQQRLTLSQGQQRLAEVALTPAWAPVRLAVAGPARIVMEAEHCDEPDDDAPRETRCFAFGVSGVRLTRTELYDVARDPAQRSDLSAGQPRLTRELLRQLLAFHPRGGAAAGSDALDPGLAKSLRDLGYLR